MVEHSSSIIELRQELLKFADPLRAAHSARFFRTGPGEYGEGDQFLGVKVPLQRSVAKQFYKQLGLDESLQLLKSPWHEERLTAIFILVLKYQKGDHAEKNRVADLYLVNARYVNNWDLVDSSAEHIVGPWLHNSPYKMKVLTRLAKSESIWERRIAMLSCFHYIKQGRADETFVIIDLLKGDKHDLIQKAVGWMLREIGKRVGRDLLIGYLDVEAPQLARTTLRYAIEHLPEDQRKHYLNRR